MNDQNTKVANYGMGYLIENDKEEWFKYDIMCLGLTIISIVNLKNVLLFPEIQQLQQTEDVFHSSPTEVDVSKYLLNLPRLTSTVVDHLVEVVESKYSKQLQHLLREMLLQNKTISQILDDPLIENKSMVNQTPSVEENSTGGEEVSEENSSDDDDDDENNRVKNQVVNDASSDSEEEEDVEKVRINIHSLSDKKEEDELEQNNNENSDQISQKNNNSSLLNENKTNIPPSNFYEVINEWKEEEEEACLVQNRLHPAVGSYLKLIKEENETLGVFMNESGEQGLYRRDLLRNVVKSDETGAIIYNSNNFSTDDIRSFLADTKYLRIGKGFFFFIFFFFVIFFFFNNYFFFFFCYCFFFNIFQHHHHTQMGAFR
jgi:hypothetical protein